MGLRLIAVITVIVLAIIVLMVLHRYSLKNVTKGSPTPPHFTDNGDGTITDNWSGIVWLKDIRCLGEKSWNEAISNVDDS